MNKAEAHALAKDLGVEVSAVASTDNVMQAISDAVEETSTELRSEVRLDDASAGHVEALERFLARAADAGFVPQVAIDIDPPSEAFPPADGPPEPSEPRPQPETPSTADVPPEIAEEVGAALAMRERSVDPTLSLPSPGEFNAALAIAERIAGTAFVPASYHGKPENVLAAILFGREIGLGPMTAMRDVHMIDGRPALAAHRQLALLRKGGVVILESESTGEIARIAARRTDTGEVMVVQFTMEEAKKIVRKSKPLVAGDNWVSYPADMLWARCVGRLSRRLGPDLMNGLPPYVAEEVADFSGWGVNYGDDGGVVMQRGAEPEIPEYQREDPTYDWPRNWPEIGERLGQCVGPNDWQEWLRQMTQALYKVDTMQTLKTVQRRSLFHKASGVLFTLDGKDVLLAENPREEIKKAFARYIGGAALDGPAWRIVDDETDRPERDGPEVIDGEVVEESESAEDVPMSATGYETDDSIVFGDPA